MLEKTRLEELSIALPDKERKELLDRISRRMEREESEEAVPVELREDEREKIIEYELRRAGWWVQFIVWMRTLLTGRRPREVFIDVRLRRLRAAIRAASPGLSGFDTRDLSPKFARKVYDLLLRVQPLLEPYRALSSDKTARAAAYAYLVEQRYEKARKTVEEFVTGNEMEEIFAETGQTDDIRRRLATRLGEYVRALPESFIGTLEEHCRMHLAIGRIVAFPFAAFLRYFNHVLPEPAEPRYPSFEHAPAMLVLDLLEKLFVPVALLRRAAADPEWAPEPLAYWLLAKSGATPADEPGIARVEGELAKLRVLIAELVAEAESFEETIPLLDIIRYFRRDPWYQLVFNPPRLFLKSLYTSALRDRIGAELEQRLGTIRERVINRKIQELLKIPKPVELQYYRENPGFDHRSLGLPTFTHVRSITFTANYLLAQYKGPILEAVNLLAGTVLANNRITQSRITQHTSTLEDLEARIVLFDRSLAPDEDDGKQLARFRFTIATDILVQKSYKGFLVQKDREARDLIEKAVDALGGVKRVLDEIRTSAFENIRSLLKTLHSWRGHNQTLGQILNARSEGIAAFLKLLDQLMELEKGG
ncbi:MAG: DUF5312 family protein [Spirochaetes bacterium]|nr:DUF5312 family protein [Spirochaetota bacterium]